MKIVRLLLALVVVVPTLIQPGEGRAAAFVPSSSLRRGGSKRHATVSTSLKSSSSSSSSNSDVASAASSDTDNTNQKLIPIHLLAGFLGSGKTSTLKHLLENKENLKLGVLVNDVASVNIDAKLIASQSESMVELQNGCACCSLADELLDSLDRLLLLQSGNNNKQNDLDAIIVELSGVADPVSIQNNWKAAVQRQLVPSVTNVAQLGRVVTVIDACTFGTDYMTFDVLQDRTEWFTQPELDECGAHRKVVELLAEQTEAADLILVNKVDLAGPEQVDITKSMAASLNDRAEIRTTTFGRVSAAELLRLGKDEKSKKEEEEEIAATAAADCTEPGCTDASHSHSHSSHDHDHSDAAATACEDADCTDPTHSHSHSSHDHNHKEEAACEDADCTDPTHSHSHSHDHSSSSSTTSTENLGITNFVYKAIRPFDANRLMTLLYQWPVPIKDELDLSLMKDAAATGYSETTKSPFVGVLRSKGFCWFAPTAWEGLLADAWRHNTAMYWSHAGKHMGIQEAGRWWASVEDDEQMKEFFATNPGEYERIRREDFVSEEWGDRRQELVFIGVGLDQEAIE